MNYDGPSEVAYPKEEGNHNYKKYIKELWAISSDIESKLEPVMYSEGPQNEESDSRARSQ